MKLILISLFISTTLHASVIGFIDELYRENAAEIEGHFQSEFRAFCDKFELSTMDENNKSLFLRIHFVHDLLTTNSASDYAVSGILRLPYLWHWIRPNPRHELISLPDSTLLCLMPSPKPYERYASRADIDRVPILFLGDAFSENAKYYHPDHGPIYSFGWCSEREMSYSLIFNAWNIPAKVYQSGIHTYSRLFCRFRTANGSTLSLIATVDNTFDYIYWDTAENGLTEEVWRQNVGHGGQVNWYNRMARSTHQMEALNKLTVGPAAGERVRRLMRSWAE